MSIKHYAAALAAGLLAAPAAFAQTPMPAQGMSGMQGEIAPAPAMKTYKVGDIVIEGLWTRATPKGSPVAGGFMTIANTGKTPDTLVGGSFALSKKFEVHQMTVKDGVMKMRQLDKGLEIAPGATVTLKPGSYHVMMIDLTAPVVQGAPVKGALRFAKAGEVAVEFTVAPIGAMSPFKSPDGKMAPGAGMGHDHMKMNMPKQ